MRSTEKIVEWVEFEDKATTENKQLTCILEGIRALFGIVMSFCIYRLDVEKQDLVIDGTMTPE